MKGDHGSTQELWSVALTLWVLADVSSSNMVFDVQPSDVAVL